MKMTRTAHPNDPGGTRKIYFLDNGLKFFVIRCYFSLGHQHGLWEIAVTDSKGIYKTREVLGISHSDYVGYLTDADVTNYLKIANEWKDLKS
jgi:hypothetical protein